MGLNVICVLLLSLLLIVMLVRWVKLDYGKVQYAALGAINLTDGPHASHDALLGPLRCRLSGALLESIEATLTLPLDLDGSYDD